MINKQQKIEQFLSTKETISKLREEMNQLNFIVSDDDIKEVSILLHSSYETAEESILSLAMESLRLFGSKTTVDAFTLYVSKLLSIPYELSADLVLMICEQDTIIDIEEPKYEGSKFMIESKLWNRISDELKIRIEQNIYLPPMLCKPDDWSTTNQGGYLSNKSHFILGSSLNKDIECNCYHKANELQKVAYSIEERMLPYQTFTTSSNGYSMEKGTKTTQQWLIDNGNKFHFVWKSDYRGRHYSQGYHVNVQGNQQQKSMLVYADKQHLTERGLHWLGIAIANAYGLDKLTMQKRSIWFKKNQSILIQDKEQFILDSEEQFTMRYLLLALEDYENGLPTGVIVHMDATNSALQIYSALYSCEDTAKLCNLHGNTREDAYGILATAMNNYLEVDFITRKHVKKAFMVHFYSAGESTVSEQLKEDMKELFSPSIVEAFYAEIEELAPAGTEGMNDIRSCWNKKSSNHSWVLPNGFEVECLSTKRVTYTMEHETFGELKYYEKVIAPNVRSTSLAPNVIHSIDAYIMSSNRGKTPIHDSFGGHPNNHDNIRSDYKDAIIQINDSELLSDILTQIQNKSTEVEKMNTLSSKSIRWATHILS